MDRILSANHGRASSPWEVIFPTIGARQNEAMEPAEFVPAVPYFTPNQLDDQRPSGARSFLSVTYAMPEGYRPLELDLFVPESATTPPACVIWIHGGGWMNGSRLHP